MHVRYHHPVFGLSDGDVITAVWVEPKVAAAILADGLVVTWREQRIGGDSSRVQDQLKNGEHIRATSKAFAAILQDGSVIAWGDREAGGDSSSSRMWSIFGPQVAHLLQSCKMDQSLHGAIDQLVVTAPESKISSRMWSIFRPQVKHLLQSCKMDQSFAGAIHRLVDALVIALETSNRCTFRWLPCDMGRSNVWRLGLSGCESA